MKKILVTLCLISAAFTASAQIPIGDTTGKVVAVSVANSTDGNNSFRVYFSTSSRDRWECIANDGYITVRSNGYGVNEDIYNKIYAAALTAQAASKSLTVNSAGTNPCINANSAMIH